MNVLVMRRPSIGRQTGFTLIEVSLAMAITVFVAALSYGALSTVLASAERHELKARRLIEVQMALTVLERDIRHMVPRGIIDEYGDGLPALHGDTGDYNLLAFTRRGWDNPAKSRRSELQRVRYQLEGEALWRENWLLPDRIGEEQGQRRELLIDGVGSVELGFLKPLAADKAATNPLGGEWLDTWSTEDDSLPQAVEVMLQLNEFGPVRRLFSVASAALVQEAIDE